MSADLRTGRWEDVLADVGEVNAVITDPPYSKRTHDGHHAGVITAGVLAGSYMKDGKAAGGAGPRRTISYPHWASSDVDAFVDAWAPRNRGWFVCLSDHSLCDAYRTAYERNRLTSFAPVIVFIPGMTVRLSGDGPSSWAIYANVARPKSLHRWGTLPGGYSGPPGEQVHIGGKPLWLMRALVRDYSRPGDLICDPCAGAATTLLAAREEGRRAIGAEVDPETAKLGLARLAKPYTPSLFDGAA